MANVAVVKNDKSTRYGEKWAKKEDCKTTYSRETNA